LSIGRLLQYQQACSPQANYESSATMGAFEYLSVLISIILASGMTRALAGVGEMLQARIGRPA
jgi:hypothetical protein